MLKTTLLIAVIIILSITTYQKSHELSAKGILSFTSTNCLRGIAILLIMVGHVSGTMHTVVFSPLASTGVTLFLILSGYGLNESYKKHGLRHFWRKKIMRVLIPYSLVFVCIAISKQDWSPFYWLLNLSGLETIYWFIAFIIKCYIIFWLSSLLLPKYRICSMFILSVALLLIGDGLEAPQAFSFALGVTFSALYSYLPPPTKPTRNVYLYIIAIGMIVGTGFLAIKQLPYVRTELYGTHLYDLVQMMINVPYAIAVIAFVITFQDITTSRFLLLSGSISYELYLVHFPFYGSLQGNLIYVAVFFILSYLVAWIYHKFINLIESNIQTKFQNIKH